MTQRTPELQRLVDSLATTMKLETWEILDIGSSHRGDCRCAMCLRYWVLVGPEEIDAGEWSFGPFTEEEFLAAGGVIPEVFDEDYDGYGQEERK